ncbi:MAG: polymer-forming cytoskeletal protein [Gammaproteobacteria bacterium]|nr:polymer-forming cytoskeletal protein [Gammaproteobacteria bacterium]MDE2251475.1 polymer-forming cytoskeletal protein [Gammaproteobacteria bacterium]
MALWKEIAAAPPAPATPTPAAAASAAANAALRPAPETAPRANFDRSAVEPAAAPVRATARAELKESLIASGLSIEGKISGTGHVRIAGQFKGDVNVEGNLGIEPGAKHQGEVRAAAVTVGGELTGNIAARHIDVTSTGVVVGDVKADTITVASGSRMRGHVEFGWGEGAPAGGRGEHKANGLTS